MQTKQLIHSKSIGGQGKCETDIERQRLFKVIRSMITFMDKNKELKKIKPPSE